MSFVKSAMSVLSVGALVVNAQTYVWEPVTGCGGASCKVVVNSECTSLSTVNEKQMQTKDWTYCNQGCMVDNDCVAFNFNPSSKGKVGGCYYLQGTCTEQVADTKNVVGVIKGPFTSAPTSPTPMMTCSMMTPVKQMDKTYSCEMDGCAIVTGGSKKTKDWTCADETGAPSPAPTSPTVYSCEGQEIFMVKVGKTKTYECGDVGVCAVQSVKDGKKTTMTCVTATGAPSPAPTSPTVYSCDGQEIYMVKNGKTKVYLCGDIEVCAVSKHGSKKSADWTCEEMTGAPSPAPTSPTVYSCSEQEIYMEKEGKTKVYKCGEMAADGEPSVCSVSTHGSKKSKDWTCEETTSAPAPAPTSPTVYSCSNYTPYMVKEGKAKVYYCGDDDICSVQKTKEGKKTVYTCVASTNAPVEAPTAPTTWSCAQDMEYIKKGKQYRNVCATPDQCELEKYEDADGKMQERCVAV